MSGPAMTNLYRRRLFVNRDGAVALWAYDPKRSGRIAELREPIIQKLEKS